MASNVSWRCPYCGQIATLLNENVSFDTHWFKEGGKDGNLGLRSQVTTCPNDKCREYVVEAKLYRWSSQAGKRAFLLPIVDEWQLRPASNARPFPDYIPQPIRDDYEEACLIQALSPKASATLSRRALQGTIRDFWKIKKGTLRDEIAALEGKVDDTTWQAIDAVRKIGNIGAHMEKDINVLVDVDPDEADLLVGLIEVLLEEWYVRRHEKEQHMQKLITTAAAKAQQAAAAKAGIAALPRTAAIPVRGESDTAS